MDAVPVCASETLLDGGLAVRLKAQCYGRDTSVFFVRFRGVAYGYLNQCAHVPTELDWNETTKTFTLTKTGEDLKTLTQRLLREHLNDPTITLP